MVSIQLCNYSKGNNKYNVIAQFEEIVVIYVLELQIKPVHRVDSKNYSVVSIIILDNSDLGPFNHIRDISFEEFEKFISLCVKNDSIIDIKNLSSTPMREMTYLNAYLCHNWEQNVALFK